MLTVSFDAGDKFLSSHLNSVSSTERRAATCLAPSKYSAYGLW